MKRAASVEISPAKKIKLYHDIFENSQQRSPEDILESGLEDDSGYIACKCYMTWRPTTKHKAIIETTGSTTRFRFDVEFGGACVDFFSEIELKAQDEFLLALQSAQIERSDKHSRSCNIPLKLVYEEGVIIKFLKRQGPCRIIDTWQLKEDARRHEDAWFLPPQDPLNSMVMDNSQSTDTYPLKVRCHTPPTGSSIPCGNPSVSSIAIPFDHDKAIPSEIPSNGAQGSKLSKRQQKKIYQQKRALMLASAHAKDTTTVTVPDSHSKPATMPASVPQTVASTMHQPVAPSDALHLSSAASVAHSSAGKTTPVVLSRITAGLEATTGQYHALADLNDLAPPTMFNVIGVVVDISSPTKTRKGEWCCHVQLVDPSNIEVENLDGREGFKINCFTRKYEQWLPNPSLGEVLIMRDLKISDFHGLKMGVGYHNKLQWAIFSPSTGKVRHGDLGDAPESEGLGVEEGFGYPFSPFFKPEEAEIRYCLKIADWWAEVEKHRKSIAEVHQVCGPSDTIYHRRPRRQHRLISEAGPHVPPDGFFDCTIEVLHGHLNDNGVYSLYVTDYSVNTSIPPVEASWCPPDLAEYVLKIEAWDGAVEVTRGMFGGEYYSIKNARMMISHGGYVEGKVVEQKIQKLDVGKDGDVNPYFKALLERKKAWKDAHQSDDQSGHFEYKTIGEAVEGKHFHCVVEVLHAVYDKHGASCIYVTDYTSRNKLVSTKVQATWGTRLQGFILRIALFNNQAEMAKTVQVGAFYDIQKLRLKQSAVAREFQGQLGGVERLIFLLNPNTSSDDRLTALKRRKADWQKSSSKTIDVPIIDNPPVKIEPVQKAITQPMRRGKTIAELRADEKCPNKNRLLARVVDFRPWKLSDAVIIHCTHCERDLPPLQNACFNCDDTDHEYVQLRFQMYFLLEDVTGDQFYVSVHDGSSVFDDIQRVDVSKDSTAYMALLNRLSPLLGNLLHLHSGPIPKEGVEVPLPNTPMLPLIIDTWEADGKHAYCLAGCDEMKNA